MHIERGISLAAAQGNGTKETPLRMRRALWKKSSKRSYRNLKFSGIIVFLALLALTYINKFKGNVLSLQELQNPIHDSTLHGGSDKSTNHVLLELLYKTSRQYAAKSMNWWLQHGPGLFHYIIYK